MPDAWVRAFRSVPFRNQAIFTLLGFIAIYLHHFHYLQVWQQRHGTQLNDIILNQLPPVDFSVLIFIIEYFTLILVILYLLPTPERFLKGVQALLLITFARTMSIYFFSLEPPQGMIHLQDPFANTFLHSKEVFVTKDLFFSGHIATLALLALLPTNQYIKTWSYIAIVVVSVMLLCQHVHYTLDILFAPVVSFVIYKLVLFAHQQSRYGLELQDQIG